MHRYLAISQYVARRIALYYNRRSTIVYPPVDTTFYTPGPRLTRPAPRRRLSDRVGARALQTRRAGHRARPRRAGVPLTSSATDRSGRGSRRWPAATCGFSAGGRTRRFATLYRSSIATILPGRRGLRDRARSKRRRAAGRSSRSAAAARSKPSIDGETGVLVDELTRRVAGRRPAPRGRAQSWDAARIRQHAERFSRDRFAREIMARDRRDDGRAAGQRW